MSLGIKIVPKSPDFADGSRVYYRETKCINREEFRGMMLAEEIQDVFSYQGAHLRLFFSDAHVAVQQNLIPYVESSGIVVENGEVFLVRLGHESTIRLNDVEFTMSVFHAD
jgi:hypothetical protein